MILPTLILMAQLSLPQPIPGTNQTYTDGKGNYWAGNPFCSEAGALLQPTSPAIDFGAIIEGFDCPVAGSSIGQPKMTDWLADNCREWYGLAPDAGACEFVPPGTFDPPASTIPASPSNVQLNIIDV